jgi:hypothetical protein
MMEFISSLILYAIIFFAVRNLMSTWRELKQTSEQFEKYHVKEGEEQIYPNELPPGVRSVKFEVLPEHDNIILCTDSENNFLCQGRTMVEVQDNFKLRFPDDAAVILDKDSQAIYQELMSHEAP